MINELHRTIIDEHAEKKATSSLAWWTEREAIYDTDAGDWINLTPKMLKVMSLALHSMAEELTLNMPNLPCTKDNNEKP